MIAFLRGRVIRRETDVVIVDVEGVGYEVFCTIRTMARLTVGDSAELQIHTAVSDDAIRLYGFGGLDELRLFRLLIGVDRIGPKAALSILGRAELSTISRAIVEGDAVLLSTVPGVGRKTADRVVLELQGKLDWIAPATSADSVSGAPALPGPFQDAIAALVGLGFREDEARRAVTASGVGDADTASVVSAALRALDSVSRR